MEKLKKRLLGLLVILILVISVLSTVYNVYAVGKEYQLNTQLNNNNLKIYIQKIESSLEDIENMLMMEAQADVQLKYIMKANSELDYYTALVNKKSQFSDEINKYQYLDGIGLFDGKNELYIGVKGKYLSTGEHTNIKTHLKDIITSFEMTKMDTWFPVQIQSQYYLIRMIQIQNIYIFTWVTPKHLLSDFQNIKGQRYYFLCKESGTILNKENQVDLVQIKGDVAKIRGNNYIVYGSPFKKSSYKFAMLERGNAREILFQRIITSITVIWLIGLGILFIVWRFTKEIFIEPVENIIMKKELQKNKAQLQFLQIQMNPHFLNNCLSLIRNMIIFEENEEAEKAVLLLGHYTRNSLCTEVTVDIEKELEHVNYWYELQKLRLEGKIKINISLEDGLEKNKIPSMLIYTFVENSVKHHGVDTGQIKIEVSIQRITLEKKKYIEVCIEDNGQGFDKKTIDLIQRKEVIIDKRGLHHIGIYNIIQRLDILYENRAQIKFTNKTEQSGAVVIIDIPCDVEKR